MRAIATIVLVTVGLTLLCAPPAQAGDKAEPEAAPTQHTVATIDRFLTERVRADLIPGLAVVVTHGDRIVHLKGYGQSDGGRPVTPDTRFPIASLSKSFTALAVLQLADAGRLDLDAPMRTYLPGLELSDPRMAAITVRHLLNQTSGLAEVADPPARTLAERVARTSLTVGATPGREFRYDNANYVLLARIVEVVSGEPFADRLRRHVLGPLHMPATTTVGTGRELAAVPGMAPGHGRAFWQAAPVSVADGSFLEGAGGVVSSARDLANWLIVHSNGGRLGDRQVLSDAGVRLLHTPPAGVPTTYAMGWGTEPPGAGLPERLTHSGNLVPYYAGQLLLPGSGYGVVVLANTGLTLLSVENLDRLTDGVAALLLQRPVTTRLSVLAKELGMLLLVLVTLAVRTVGFVRLSAWSRARAGRSRWRLLPGMVWLVGPAVLLAAGWFYVATAIPARDATQQVFWFSASVHVWLLTLAASGLALAVARVILLLRGARRHERSGGVFR